MSTVLTTSDCNSCAKNNQRYPKNAFQSYQEYVANHVSSGPKTFLKKYPAVVDIRSEADFVSGNEPREIIALEGNGFFVGKSRYIITSSRVVLYDLSLGPTREPPAPDDIYVLPTAIYVTVHNVCGRDVVYQAVVVGVDGAGGVAVLYIDPTLEWNVGLPSLCNHPTLAWGCSRNAAPGSEAYSLGIDIYGEYEMVKGGVVNNRFYDYADDLVVETVLSNTQSAVLPENGGYPIIDVTGKVIGVAVNTNGENVISISQFMAERVTKTIISSRYTGSALSPHLEAQVDPALYTFYRYIKGYLGATFDAVQVEDLLDVSPITYKDLSGLIVRTLDGVNGSPLTGIVAVGDIVTEINGRCLGVIAPEEIPSVYTWFLLEDAQVTLTYRTVASDYATVTKSLITLDAFPLANDFLFQGFQVNKEDGKQLKHYKKTVRKVKPGKDGVKKTSVIEAMKKDVRVLSKKR